ncbi:MAG: hypothetical protein DLM68_08990 [Hyphomicrobiales bacterium]|nr:MAG: hypothetical protein DLM68_08990 [Hyphomicrobiales bacterium]
MVGFSSLACLERVPIKWNHLIEKDTAQIKELEHVLIEKVEQLFRDMLYPRAFRALCAASTTATI